MTHRSIEIELAPEVYQELEIGARRTGRSVPQLAANWLGRLVLRDANFVINLVSAVTEEPDYELEDVGSFLSELVEFDDEALQKVLADRFPRAASQRLEELNHQAQRDSLDVQELAERKRLLEGYERFVLLRAEAAALLKARGFDVALEKG